MQRHVDRVAHAADARRVDLGGVKVLHRAQADGPADGVDEDGRDCRVRRRCVVGGPPLGHVDGHVDVRDSLEEEAGQQTPASAELIDQGPGEDHGENELEDAIGARRDERLIWSLDAGVREDLRELLSVPVCACQDPKMLTFGM